MARSRVLRPASPVQIQSKRDLVGAAALGAHARVHQAPPASWLAVARACSPDPCHLNMSEGEKSGYNFSLGVKDGSFDSLCSHQPHDCYFLGDANFSGVA